MRLRCVGVAVDTPCHSFKRCTSSPLQLTNVRHRFERVFHRVNRYKVYEKEFSFDLNTRRTVRDSLPNDFPPSSSPATSPAIQSNPSRLEGLCTRENCYCDTHTATSQIRLACDWWGRFGGFSDVPSTPCPVCGTEVLGSARVNGWRWHW